MITVLADTHGTDDPRLTGRTAAAVRDAALVVHAGDFTTEAVLDAFRHEAASLAAVAGNGDAPSVRDRLDATTTVDHDGLRITVVHGHDHDATALSLLARQEDADLVVVGHSHRPGTERLGETLLLNPGSHAEPRRYRAAHAELERSSTGWRGRLVSPDGETFESFDVET